MTGSINELLAIKKHLDELSRSGLVQEWSVSYINGRNRLVAADFVLTPAADYMLEQIYRKLAVHRIFQSWLHRNRGQFQQHFTIEFNRGFSG